ILKNAESGLLIGLGSVSAKLKPFGFGMILRRGVGGGGSSSLSLIIQTPIDWYFINGSPAI
ncbi:hypothetical protein C6381_03805, partial [Pseudomonas syringae pv. actinidiae]